MKKYGFVPSLILVGIIFLGFFVSFDSQKVYASEDFLPLGQTSRYWAGISIDSSNQNVYAVTGIWSGGDIYKQTGGTGNFVALGQTSRYWRSISVDSLNHDVYAGVEGGDIYKQTGGIGDFVALGQIARSWRGISIDSSNHNVYATDFISGNVIYKQTGGVGNFVSLPTGLLFPDGYSPSFPSIAVDSSNQNVYIVNASGDIYKQTGGTGNFVALGQASRNWISISVDSSNHNVYAVNAENNGDVYKQTGGIGDFVALGQISVNWRGISVDSSNHNVYAVVFNGDIYKMTAINGTLTPASPSCFIASGASSCDINFSWSPLIATAAITSSYPVANTVVASGSPNTDVPFAIPYLSSPRTFYFYNNAVLLAQSTVTSSCIEGTNWNGSICAPIMSGTLTATNCIIAPGAASCNTSLNWSTTNPVVTSAVTSSYPVANTSVATGNSGNNVSVAIPYLSSPRDFYLYNNGVELSPPGGVSATASCVEGTIWDGNTCVSSGGGGSCDSTTWYNPGATWTNRKVITIDHTKVQNTNQTNFPILISRTDSDLKSTANGGYVGQSNGNDIVFSSDGATKLSHEIEKYDPTTGQLIAWVNIPNLSSSVDTVIYMYYGNAVASNQQNVTGVWNSNYKGVWHLSNATTVAVRDSTGIVNLANFGPAADGVGKIGGGASFSSAQGLYSTLVPTTATDNFTLSLWVNLNNTSGEQILISNGKDDGVSTFSGYAIETESNNWTLLFNGIARVGSGVAVSTGWNYLTLVRNSGNSTLYLNGNSILTNATTPNAPSTIFTIGSQGKDTTPTLYRFANAIIDETRVSNSTRSTDWIKTEYNNQSSPSTFYGVSAQCVPAASLSSVTLTATPPIPQINTNITIGWTVLGATNGCTANQASGWNLPTATKTSADGTYSQSGIMISTLTTYTLTCLNALLQQTIGSITVNPVSPDKFVTITPLIGGTVTSNDGFISCLGGICVHRYANLTPVTLTAVPLSANWKFVGWKAVPAICPAIKSPTCSFTVGTSDISVQAIFAPKPIEYAEF